MYSVSLTSVTIIASTAASRSAQTRVRAAAGGTGRASAAGGGTAGGAWPGTTAARRRLRLDAPPSAARDRDHRRPRPRPAARRWRPQRLAHGRPAASTTAGGASMGGGSTADGDSADAGGDAADGAPAARTRPAPATSRSPRAAARTDRSPSWRARAGRAAAAAATRATRPGTRAGSGRPRRRACTACPLASSTTTIVRASSSGETPTSGPVPAFGRRQIGAGPERDAPEPIQARPHPRDLEADAAAGVEIGGQPALAPLREARERRPSPRRSARTACSRSSRTRRCPG